jgi:hypothetical protein
MFIMMVTGPRKFNSKKLVWETLTQAVVELDRGLPSLLIHGDGDGVDEHSDSWAKSNGIPTDPMPPEYENFKGFRHVAPLARNTDLVNRADVVVGIWDGLSTGTKDAIKKALQGGKIVRVYKTDGNQRPRLLNLFEIGRLIQQCENLQKERRKARKNAGK